MQQEFTEWTNDPLLQHKLIDASKSLHRQFAESLISPEIVNFTNEVIKRADAAFKTDYSLKEYSQIASRVVSETLPEDETDTIHNTVNLTIEVDQAKDNFIRDLRIIRDYLNAPPSAHSYKYEAILSTMGSTVYTDLALKAMKDEGISDILSKNTSYDGKSILRLVFFGYALLRKVYESNDSNKADHLNLYMTFYSEALDKRTADNIYAYVHKIRENNNAVGSHNYSEYISTLITSQLENRDKQKVEQFINKLMGKFARYCNTITSQPNQ